MNDLPPFLEVSHYPGADDSERWAKYIDGLYTIYTRTVAFANLEFRGLPVRCQFRPETNGKHFAFWHMMQEGEIEDDRHIDPERCRRVAWIAWVIRNAEANPAILVFSQQRGRETSWVLWLRDHRYAVILWERKDKFLLKTAFLVKPHGQMQFEKEWQAYNRSQNG